MKLVADRQAELNRWGQIKYKARKAAFVLGLIALLVARGMKPVLDLFAVVTR